MNKATISNTLRKLRLLYPFDKLRFKLEQRKNRSANLQFKKQNPDIILPPDYLMYESFQMNYSKYYLGGRETAKWILKILNKHKNIKSGRILDWGCGPARVIRHIPEFMNFEGEYHGTDYNPTSIDWCQKNINNVTFNLNGLEAKLPYDNEYFDAIYGISIFTHLSEEMHFAWIEELKRILKPGGILLITTQGENFKSILSSEEVNNFNKGHLVVRGNVKEGHRTYSAFHPDSFMHSMIGNELTVSEKIVLPKERKSYTPQDTWVLKKR